ncbi:YfhO family protein [Catenulispora pinisilvae]|uniref:YfhO family protein n=1 Tax=Catenulispora pinisilvae TaxID=2705253 RepID=UPI0018925FE6|nr:YfhO family protein [Catenulispora pinisilvae]
MTTTDSGTIGARPRLSARSLLPRPAAIRRNLYLVLAFVIPSVLYAGILASRGIYPFDPHGTYTVFMSDLNNQYAQFYSYFDQALTGHGSLLFTWRADGGMNFWPIVAYYLTSPFGLLTLFASDHRLPMMIAFATVLKLGAAGLAMALFLRKFRGEAGQGRDSAVNKAVIVALSTAYALGAWSLIYAFNVMWLDALYLLPLALLGVERLLAKGRVTLLAVAVGLNLIIDFYTGAMIVVFVCMYALARYVGVRERFERADFLRTAGKFVMAGVIGGLLAAAFILPTYLGGLKQKTTLHAASSGAAPPKPLLSVLVRFLGGSADTGQLTPNVGAATLIVVLVPLFFLLKGIKRSERIAFGAILAFLVLAMEVKPLYLLMHGGQMPNAFPWRFTFLITALLAFMAFRAWVGVDSVKQIKWLGASAVFWLVILYWGRQSYPWIIRPRVAQFDALILVAGTAVLAFALYLRVRPADEPLSKRLAWMPKRLATPKAAAVVAVAVLAVDASGSAELIGQKSIGKLGPSNSSATWSNWYSSPTTSYGTALSSLQPSNDQFFRAEGYDQNLRSTNDSLRYGNFGFTHFSSLSSGKLHETMQDLGFAHHEADVWSAHTGATLFTDALLGYQYLVGTTRETTDGTIDRLDSTLQKTYDNTAPAKPGKTVTPDVTTVYKINSTLPVGFRLTGPDLTDFTAPLPQNSPFAAQEQAFGMPGAFQSMCGSPTITASPGVTVTPGGDGTVSVKIPAKARADKQLYSDKIVWHCQASGPRQVYLYAPNAMPTGLSYARLDSSDRPAPLNVSDPSKDKTNIAYPGGFDNGFQDLGSVQSGSFTVTMLSDALTQGNTYKVPANPIRGLDPTAVDAKLAQLRSGGVTDVHWNSTGISATTTGDSAATVFLSVPTIPGWSVTVDGKSVKTTKLLGSFTGVPVPAGTHRISMSFSPPGLYAGIGGSTVGLLALGGVWWFQRRRAAHQSAATPAAGRGAGESVPQDVLS